MYKHEGLIVITRRVKMTNNTVTLKKITEHLTKADELARQLGLGDIYSYSRVKEVLIANKLGHTVNTEYSGADGFEPDGRPAEYKSTVSNKIQATYNGISVQKTWNEQVEYLTKDKIGKYDNHYFARFVGTNIAEIWKLKAQDVLNSLIDKLKGKFDTIRHKKDPRLGYTINSNLIKKYGKQIV